MKAFRRIVMLLGLLGLAALTVLAIVGAFMGTKRAAEFFNSRPLTVFWAAFAIVLIISVVASRNVGRCGGLLAMHVGCVLIIAGAMWGSDEAHRLRAEQYNEEKLASGLMMLAENRMTGHVTRPPRSGGGEMEFHVLDFQVRLDSLPPCEKWLIGVAAEVQTADGPHKLQHQIDWQPGRPVMIPFTDIELEVIEQVGTGRPRIRLSRGEKWLEPTPMVQTDRELFPLECFYDDEEQWKKAGSPTLILQRPASPFSEMAAKLAVVSDGKVIERADVRPNHPMHYGGYHFYLLGPDEDGNIWLRVVSDSGLIPVYTGFAMLCLGAFWQFWIRPLYRTKTEND